MAYPFSSRVILAALMPIALSGCVGVAILAVPTVTTIAKVRQNQGAGQVEVASANPEEADTAAALPASAAPEPATPRVAPPGSAEQAALLAAFERYPAAGLPASQSTAWNRFTTFALTRKADLEAGRAVSSAVLTPESPTMLTPRTRPCKPGDMAVIVDLDPSGASFDPSTGLTAQAGVAGSLARLRDAGVRIMWISQLDPNRVSDIAGALAVSGLDPTGRDPILLSIGEAHRKQELRDQASTRACILAIAGDERSDFDELFGYLRDPQLATAFDSLIGSGWFLVPGPMGPDER